MTDKPTENFITSDSLTLPEDGDTGAFTGERFIPALGGEIEVEHYHRYFFATLFCSNKDVLDIACGEGYGTYLVSQKAKSVVGVDISESTVANAKSRYGEKNRRFLVGSCEAIPCEAASFDLVVSFETIEHITFQKAFLDEVRRVLRPGGIFLISSPEKKLYDESRTSENPFHEKELSRQQFGELLSASFKNVKYFGQSNAFGSFISPENDPDPRFINFFQTGKTITTSQSEPATYSIAICGDEALPQRSPLSYYGLPDSAYQISALTGGIRERDAILADSRAKIEQLEERHDALEQRFLSNTARAKREFVELNDQCAKRGANLEALEAANRSEIRKRIALEALAGKVQTDLTHLSLLQKIEGDFLENEGLLLRHALNCYSPRNRIAKLIRSDGQANHRKILELSKLFDSHFYREKYSGASIKQYMEEGWREAKQPNPLFDSNFFNHNANGKTNISRDPVLTYLLQEPGNLRDPHPLFSTAYYLSQVPNNKFAARFPLTHYLIAGGFCGLNPHPLFDSQFYLLQNPDVKEALVNPLVHYIRHGARENRQPHPCFNVGFYRKQHTEEFHNPLLHYLSSISKRSPNKLFSADYYKHNNKDVFNAKMDPFVHFLQYGEKEGRNPHPFFDVSYYRQNNPDVAASGQNTLGHFSMYGESERRIPYEQFDSGFYQNWHVNIGETVEIPFAHFIDNYGSEFTGQDGKLISEIQTSLKAQDKIDSKSPLVSVIIPVYGKLSYTLRCLRSLARHQTKYSFEIIVVDDLSPDDTQVVLKTLTNIRLIAQEKNQGFIASCNAGAYAALGSKLLFLNNDTEVLTGWLDELVETFQVEKNCGSVGSKLIYPTGQLQEAGGIIWGDGSAWNFGNKADRNDPDYNFLRAADYVSGASLMISKSLFLEVGGFDTHYAPAYAEDCDLAFKVRDRGLKVLYQPMSQVVHCEGISSGTNVSSGVKRFQTVNLEKLHNRWRKEIAQHGIDFSKAAQAADRHATATALFFDATTPTPDKDGGSLLAYYWMKALRDLRYAVTFVPQDNLLYDPYYTPLLQKEGIRCLFAPYKYSMEQIIKENPGELKLAIIFRYQVGKDVIPFLRKYQPQAKIIFHNIDLHYLRLERQAAIESDPTVKHLAGLVKVEELKVHGDADLIHTLSEFEKKEILTHLPNVKVEVSLPIQDCWSSEASFETRQDICFMGGYRHPPNVDAALFFVHEVMPLLRKKKLNIRLLLVGAGAPAEITALECDDVILKGHVKDLREIFSTIRLSVAPIRYGAGVKTKVSASMGYGVPVVATPIAIEGMGLNEGQNVVVAETAEQMADAIARLYSDPQLWQSVSQEAFRYASERYSLNSFTLSFAEQLRKLYPEK